MVKENLHNLHPIPNISSFSFSLWIHHFSTCHTVVHGCVYIFVPQKFPIQALTLGDVYTLRLRLYFKGDEYVHFNDTRSQCFIIYKFMR